MDKPLLLARLQEICLNLPEVRETVKWGQSGGKSRPRGGQGQVSGTFQSAPNLDSAVNEFRTILIRQFERK